MFQINDYVLYQEQVCQIKEQKKNEFTGLDCYILVHLPMLLCGLMYQ